MYNLLAKPKYLPADAIVNEGRTLLLGLTVECTADGSSVTLYDGMDTVSGDKKMVVKNLAGSSNPLFPAAPVLFDRGLYVDLGTNITSVTVFWCDANQTFYEQVESRQS